MSKKITVQQRTEPTALSAPMAAPLAAEDKDELETGSEVVTEPEVTEVNEPETDGQTADEEDELLKGPVDSVVDASMEGGETDEPDEPKEPEEPSTPVKPPKRSPWKTYEREEGEFCTVFDEKCVDVKEVLGEETPLDTGYTSKEIVQLRANLRIEQVEACRKNMSHQYPQKHTGYEINKK